MVLRINVTVSQLSLTDKIPEIQFIGRKGLFGLQFLSHLCCFGPEVMQYIILEYVLKKLFISWQPGSKVEKKEG